MHFEEQDLYITIQEEKWERKCYIHISRQFIL